MNRFYLSLDFNLAYNLDINNEFLNELKRANRRREMAEYEDLELDAFDDDN